jgi:predicted transcriptional regulator of viral defense system
MGKVELQGLSTQERELISIFSANEKVTITSNDIREIRSCSKEMANQILSRLAKKGWLQRIKRGVYSIVPISALTINPMIEEIWPLVVDLFKPAYISGWTAAEHWDLTEQIFNSISIVTQIQPRKNQQLISGVKVRLRVLKEEYFFGISNIWFGSNKVAIANPDRLIVDILDMPGFGGGGRHTVDIVNSYWKSDIHDSDQLLEYALKYGKGTVIKRIGFLAENFKAPVTKNWLKKCQTNITQGISDLDPDSPSKGIISSKWNLRINLPI